MIKNKQCDFCGRTDGKIRQFNNTGKYYCTKHYYHMREYGECLARTVRDLNEIILYDDYAEILLYNNMCEEIGKTQIDLDDVEKVKHLKWSISKCSNIYYVTTKINNKVIYLHRFVMDIVDKKELVIDHINHCTLDNRKNNLRICRQADNRQNNSLLSNNKSGIIGVSRRSDCDRWASFIQLDRKGIYLGLFKSLEDAIIARLKAEKEYFKDFAPQKHLFEQYGIE